MTIGNSSRRANRTDNGAGLANLLQSHVVITGFAFYQAFTLQWNPVRTNSRFNELKNFPGPVFFLCDFLGYYSEETFCTVQSPGTHVYLVYGLSQDVIVRPSCFNFLVLLSFAVVYPLRVKLKSTSTKT